MHTSSSPGGWLPGWQNKNMQQTNPVAQTGLHTKHTSHTHCLVTAAGTSGLTVNSNMQQPLLHLHTIPHQPQPLNTATALCAVPAGAPQPSTPEPRLQLLPRCFKSTGHTMTGEGVTCSAWEASHRPPHQRACRRSAQRNPQGCQPPGNTSPGSQSQRE